MAENLYMILDLNKDPDVESFRRCLGTVHPVSLSDPKHIWDFLGLVEHRYVNGLYIPSARLAGNVSLYTSYTETPTGFADTIWWNQEQGVVCGNDSAYDALGELIVPFLFGKKDVMGVVLGTGRMAKAAVATMYPLCLYLNVASRGNSDAMFDIETIIADIVEKTGKATCAVEGTSYDAIALEPMDVIVNATPVPLNELVPGFTPTKDQLVIDLTNVKSILPTLYTRVISTWTHASRDEFMKNRNALDEYYGCHP